MANPTWFDAKAYMVNKLAQLKATDPKGAWTEDKLTKAMDEAGYKGEEGAFKHFNDFGMDENVSPNAAFNVSEYLAAKAQQLNDIKFEGKIWDSASVMDAIKAAGMNAWEHYDLYGSKEGINPSNAFNAESYIAAKTVLMNETKEGGRANWTIDEVKAAFEANGFSALEHYNLFGKDEFKAAGKETVLEEAIKVKTPVDADKDFDPSTGVKTYITLADALAAQKAGSLAVNYTITDASFAGDITVAQQATLKDFLAAATPAITTTPKYHLVDTVAAITAASTTVLANSVNKEDKAGYDIADTIANVVMGDDKLVSNAEVATAKVAFTAKALEADGKTDTAATVTTVKYDDIDGKAGAITLAKADAKAEGKAEIIIDATAHAALGTDAKAFLVAEADDAFVNADTFGATFKFMATAKADVLDLGVAAADFKVGSFASINAGLGDDTFILGVKEDTTIASGVAIDGGEGKDTLKLMVATGTADRSIDFNVDSLLTNVETIDLSGVKYTGSSNQQFTLSIAEQTENFTIDAKANNTEAKVSTFKIYSGKGADTINLGADTKAEIVYGKDSFAAMDTISGITNDDKIVVNDIASMAVATGTGITDGVLKLTGTTLTDALAEANKAAETNGEAVAFVLNGDSYVFVQNGDSDFVVELADVTTLKTLTLSGTTDLGITLA